MTVYIFPVTDIRSLRTPQDGHYGYLMQAVQDGRVAGFRTAWSDLPCRCDTQGALLWALTEAAGRINDSSVNVLIVSDNKPVIDGILHLHQWEKDGWKRSRGREIRRKKQWQKAAKALEGMKLAAQKMDSDKMEQYMRQIEKEA